jgi:hypothetical protein
MVANALVIATQWGEYRLFDWWVIRNAMPGSLVMDRHNALHGAVLFTLGFAYVNIGRISAVFAQVNDFLDLPNTVEAHTAAD